MPSVGWGPCGTNPRNKQTSHSPPPPLHVVKGLFAHLYSLLWGLFQAVSFSHESISNFGVTVVILELASSISGNVFLKPTPRIAAHFPSLRLFLYVTPCFLCRYNMKLQVGVKAEQTSQTRVKMWRMSRSCLCVSPPVSKHAWPGNSCCPSPSSVIRMSLTTSVMTRMMVIVPHNIWNIHGNMKRRLDLVSGWGWARSVCSAMTDCAGSLVSFLHVLERHKWKVPVSCNFCKLLIDSAWFPPWFHSGVLMKLPPLSSRVSFYCVLEPGFSNAVIIYTFSFRWRLWHGSAEA